MEYYAGTYLLWGLFMSQDDMKQVQVLREIAARVASETNPNKVVDLAKELIRALDESSSRRLDQVTAESKGDERGAA
jgi:hypothetical protein